MPAKREHRPVLIKEVLEALVILPEGCYVDGTFGRGGHSGLILEALGKKGRLLAIDKDPEAIVHGRMRFVDERRLTLIQGSFAMLQEMVQQLGWDGKVNGILLDLGVSSPQLDQAERGFSFIKDGPLDMRMNNVTGMSAAEWLETAEATEIAGVLKEFGEERFSKRIAAAIVAARADEPIMTTARLAEIISNAIPVREKGKHPATRSFQAIRIYINRELDDLAECLDQSLQMLAPGGRLAVISFHSLEDRIVKRFIRDRVRGDYFPLGVPVTQSQMQPKLRMVGKAIRSSRAEVADNPRARSAILRVAERLA